MTIPSKLNSKNQRYVKFIGKPDAQRGDNICVTALALHLKRSRH